MGATYCAFYMTEQAALGARSEAKRAIDATAAARSSKDATPHGEVWVSAQEEHARIRR